MHKLQVALAVLLMGSTGFVGDLRAGGSKLAFDQLVTPGVIFGSGNDNGAFTTDRRKGIEVGLRIKQRFPPANLFNSNGDGTYSFPAGDACPGYSFSPTCLTTPIWSVEWSINTDYTGSTGRVLGDFIYELGLDADPSEKTDFTIFDNISPSLVAPLFDHATGDNFTTAPGNSATTAAEYENNLAVHNVAQNSWNYEFFNTLGTSLEDFDPAVDGNYVIYLRVKHPTRGRILAESRIQVLVGDAEPIKDGDDDRDDEDDDD